MPHFIHGGVINFWESISLDLDRSVLQNKSGTFKNDVYISCRMQHKLLWVSLVQDDDDDDDDESDEIWDMHGLILNL